MNTLIELVTRFQRIYLLDSIVEVLGVQSLIDLDIFLYLKDQLELLRDLGDVLLTPHVALLDRLKLRSVLIR